jgi:hypothetical protein
MTERDIWRTSTEREDTSASRVWVVTGWDELPRAVFDSEQAARKFAETQRDYHPRDLNEDGSGHDTYPFIEPYNVRSAAPTRDPAYEYVCRRTDMLKGE